MKSLRICRGRVFVVVFLVIVLSWHPSTVAQEPTAGLDAMSALAQYRLFRPLALDSPHYQPYRSDAQLAAAISEWTNNIMLGGHTYDLEVRPSHVFQLPSNMMNRSVYIAPVWDGDLVRKIVLGAEAKTGAAVEQCGDVPLEELSFSGGILVLKRAYIRGTKTYREHHDSDSEWFEEDRYYLDVYVEAKPVRRVLASKGKRRYEQLRPALRVFHDSVGCVLVPNWSPPDDVQLFNNRVRQYVPEYYPEPEEIIMSWHELAVHLGVESTGLYALANLISSHEAGLLSQGILNVVLFGEYEEAGQTRVVPLDPNIDGSQPLPAALSRQYERFKARVFRVVLSYPPLVPYTADTYIDTRPPSGEIGLAVIRYLEEASAGDAAYLGDGFFRLGRKSGTTLTAGTGMWGSPEYGPIEIEDGDDSGSSGPPSNSDVNGQGVTGLTVDALRYLQREKIAQEIADCRADATTAACVDCVSESTGQLYHDLGIAADAVDVLTGIAACIVATLFGHPEVCGVTLPSAGAAAEDFWENTFGGYDYAEDMCSGLPDRSTPYGVEDEEEECETNLIGWTGFEDVTMEKARESCVDFYGERNAQDWLLTKISWVVNYDLDKEINCHRPDDDPPHYCYIVYCIYCPPFPCC